MDSKFRIEYYQDGIYQVIDIENEKSVMEGSYADCYSYIKWKQEND